MTESVHKAVWGLLGDSARGASHLRTGLPNQDALGMWPAEGGPVAVLTVSDGHGSAMHFRSQEGSRMATEVALAALRGVAIPPPEGIERQLPHAISQAWNEAVTAHLAQHPFQDEEWTRLPANDLEHAKAIILEQPTVAYGATLLAVLATEDEVLLLQLGDGDILCVDDHGVVTKPVPGDSRLVANQTTSLCQVEAAEEFRTARLRAGETPLPALILVSSDGYANSFQSEEDFSQVGPDYLQLLKQHGAEKVAAQLGRILGEATRKGSGDDITLGILQRVETKPAEEKVPMPDDWVGIGDGKPSAGQPEPEPEAAEAPPAAAAFRWKRLVLAAACILAAACLALALWRPAWLSKLLPHAAAHRVSRSFPGNQHG